MNKIFTLCFLSLLLTITIACKEDSKPSTEPVATEANTPSAKSPAMSHKKAGGKGNRTGGLPQKTFRLKDNEINGVKAGMVIKVMRKELARSRRKINGETTEVFVIIDDKGGALGYVVPRIGDTDLVGDMTLTSSKALTPHGIRVGDSYEKLKESVPEIKIEKSDINARQYAAVGNIYYWLEASDDSKNVNDLKVKEIMIKDKS